MKKNNILVIIGNKIDICGEIPERSKGTDCKSVGTAFAGSNPALATILCQGFVWWASELRRALR